MKKDLTIKDELTEFLLYTAPSGDIKVEAFLYDENIWLTQKRMAELFGVDRSVITKHLKNIFESKELKEKSVSAKFTHTASDDKKYEVKFYNLDAILSVGYRVNSIQATQFRKWASKILEGHGKILHQQAKEKAFKEYNKFNKTQEINSDFEKQIKKLSDK